VPTALFITGKNKFTYGSEIAKRLESNTVGKSLPLGDLPLNIAVSPT
jgi:hypothetical protein